MRLDPRDSPRTLLGSTALGQLLRTVQVSLRSVGDLRALWPGSSRGTHELQLAQGVNAGLLFRRDWSRSDMRRHGQRE